MLKTISGSRLGATLLGWFNSHPTGRFFVRELAAILKEDATNVSRELARLEKSGILVSTVEGNKKYFRINRASSALTELTGLFAGVTSEPSDDAKDSPAIRSAAIRKLLRLSKRKLSAFCERHSIKQLALFGSVLREDFKPESDIDILVEFEPDKTPGLLKSAEIEQELSALFGNRQVDLRTREELSLYFRDKVIREAEVLCP